MALPPTRGTSNTQDAFRTTRVTPERRRRQESTPERRRARDVRRDKARRARVGVPRGGGGEDEKSQRLSVGRPEEKTAAIFCEFFD